MMRRTEAYKRLMAAVRGAGYTHGRPALDRRGLGWEFRGTIEHPDQSYKTTSGTSCEYQTRWWAPTLTRLVRKVEVAFGGGDV